MTENITNQQVNSRDIELKFSMSKDNVEFGGKIPRKWFLFIIVAWIIWQWPALWQAIQAAKSFITP
jgi:hypothetical protein